MDEYDSLDLVILDIYEKINALEQLELEEKNNNIQLNKKNSRRILERIR